MHRNHISWVFIRIASLRQFRRVGPAFVFMALEEKSFVNIDKQLVITGVPIRFEPEHDKMNKMTCAPDEDSDQPGHLPSLISLRCPHEEALGPSLPIKHIAKTDQTGQMRRPILVFDGSTGYFIGFVMFRLIFSVLIKKNFYSFVLSY